MLIYNIIYINAIKHEKLTYYTLIIIKWVVYQNKFVDSHEYNYLLYMQQTFCFTH